MIVGYRLINSLCTASCKSALEDAILNYGTPVILNSDQGSQFTSESWVKTLAHYKIKISMTGKGRCTDNAYIERLWRAFKYEGSYLYQWNTVEDLKTNNLCFLTLESFFLIRDFLRSERTLSLFIIFSFLLFYKLFHLHI